MSIRTASAAILCLTLLAQTPSIASAQLTSSPTFFAVDPTGMYLRGEGAFGFPLILDLGPASDGRSLQLNPTGLLQVAGAGSPSHDAVFCGIFSSSSALLAPSELNRVVGAVAPPSNVFGSCSTGPTFYSHLTTDVAYDFFIPFEGLSVSVPNESRFLFVAVPDDYAPDNLSPDPSQYGIRVSMSNTTVPEPSSFALSGIGLTLVALVASRRRRLNRR